MTKFQGDSRIVGGLEYELVNGISGDPAVHITFKQHGFGVLCDIGHLDNMSTRKLLKVDTVLVSHTHIDHFIGFDRLLRAIITNGCDITICGPKGISRNVFGKLSGYTWNLLDDDQLIFSVVEWELDHSISYFELRNQDGFEPKLLRNVKIEDPSPVIHVLPNGATIRAVQLDHKIPVLAYSIEEPERARVDIQSIVRLGLTPGPWIKQLQKDSLVDFPRKESNITVDDKLFDRKALWSEIGTIEKGTSMIYGTDFLFSKENLESLNDFPHGVDVAILESCFSVDDLQRARDTFHLTTRQSATIAVLLKAKSYFPFHHSAKYGAEVQKVNDEAMTEFRTINSFSESVFKEFVSASLED